MSVLFAPLISGDEVRGRISLQNLDRTNAFSESDVRLLTTLAGSLSVALENARLLHETRQRNAELAIINSVQQGLAGELDMQAIYDLVGDKIREIFDAQVVESASTTGEPGCSRSLHDRARRSPPGRADSVDRLPQARHGDARAAADQRACRRGSASRYGTRASRASRPCRSSSSRSSRGTTSIGRHLAAEPRPRRTRSAETDVRLLDDARGSLSVALENARLFDETRQRNAELAMINSVQQALAASSICRRSMTLVGDKIQEIFDAQVVSISILDEPTGLLQLPYMIERGERCRDASRARRSASRGTWSRRASGRHQRGHRGGAAVRQPRAQGNARRSRSCLSRSSPAPAARRRSRSKNVDREHAFSEADQRLLETLGEEPERGARERAPVRRDAAARTRAELAVINSVQQGLAAKLDDQAIVELVGDKIRDIFDAEVVDHQARRGDRPHALPVLQRARHAAARTPMRLP